MSRPTVDDDGWIQLHRVLLKNPLWYSERFTPGQAWVDLLLRAAHKRHTVQLKRSSAMLIVERGQVLTSQKALAERWKWDRKTVRGFLRGRARANKLTIQTAKVGPTGYTLLSITNWDAYQGGPEELPHPNPGELPIQFPIASPSPPHDQEDLLEQDHRDPVTPSFLETGHSDTASPAAIGPRYRRTSTDRVWFNADDTISWAPDIESELLQRFPSRTRQIQRRGKTWLDELRGLSNWHASCPPSKKKRMTAQRWLFGRKFPQEERDAVHAEAHRPAPRDVTPGRAAPKTFGQLKDEDTAGRIERARERDQRKEELPSQATKALPKPWES